MILRKLILSTTLCLGLAMTNCWAEVYVKNRLFKGASSGTGSATLVEAEPMLKAMGLTDYRVSGSQLEVRGGTLSMNGNMVSLAELTKAVGAKLVLNKDLGTIDVYLGGDTVILAAAEPVEATGSKTKALPAPAGPAKWHAKWEDAAREAKTKNRIVLALATGSDWCPSCIKLQNEILSTKAFQDWASNNVVLWKVEGLRNTPQSEEAAADYNDFLQKYKVKGVPEIIFLRPDGQEQGVRYGYDSIPPEEWIRAVEANMAP